MPIFIQELIGKMKKRGFSCILFFSILSATMFGQDSNITQTPNKWLNDSSTENQISKFTTQNYPQFSIIYIRINGFNRFHSYYTLKEIDSGVFYCKNNFGYSHLFRLNGEKGLMQDLPVGKNYYLYRKQTGTDVFDEVVINYGDKSVTLNSLDGEVLSLLVSGKCNFYLNKRIFSDIQNNLK
jgi:hypothetical protein